MGCALQMNTGNYCSQDELYKTMPVCMWKHAIHSTMQALHSTMQAIHSTKQAMRSTKQAMHSTMQAMHSTMQAMRNTMQAMRNTMQAMHSIMQGMRRCSTRARDLPVLPSSNLFNCVAHRDMSTKQADTASSSSGLLSSAPRSDRA